MSSNSNMAARRKNICFITGSRAEYGLLAPLMTMVRNDSRCRLQIVATAMHLSPEFGQTVKEITRDGFFIDEQVEMLLSSDTAAGTAKSMGLGAIGLADAVQRLHPDVIVLLGDRFESFIAAAVANIFRIPVAHLHGGEITAGAFDEAFRHSMTKMSSLHFTATEEYRRRVIQLGEHPRTVFHVGAIGLDVQRKEKLMTKRELEKDLGIRFGEKNLLVTFHPVTTEYGSAERQCSELLSALDGMPDVFSLFTKANADTEGRTINAMIERYCAARPGRAAVFASLGHRRYLSLLRVVDGIVGNSSSGLIEAPSYHIGTVNIGRRQEGRIKARSVIDCSPDVRSIRRALRTLYSSRFRRGLATVKNPYFKKNTVQSIFRRLQEFSAARPTQKKFYDLPL